MAFFAMLAVALGLQAGTALAHAALLSSSPSDGAVLTAPPAQFTLTFDETVAPISVRLIAADGSGVDLQNVTASNQSVTVPAPKLSTGTHALSWRVISADGHPVGGSIVFSIGEVSAQGIAVNSATPLGLAAAIWFARVLLYIGLFAGVGGAFFAAWIAPLPSAGRRLVAGAMFVGVVAAIASLTFQGLDVLDVPPSALTTSAPWSAAVGTSYAVTLGLEVVALLLAALSLRLSSDGQRTVAMVAVVLIGAALAASGHSADAAAWLPRLAIFVHGMMITLWLGSLIPLTMLLRGSDTVGLDRFSRLVLLPVGLLVLSGITLALSELGSVDALWATVYGQILSAKLVAVVVLLALATWNRVWLTPPIMRGDAGARRAMRRSIAVETVLVAIILGLVAGWRFTPPPRAFAVVAAAAPPIHFHVHTSQAMADVSLTPGAVGPLAVSIAVENGDFTPLDAKDVTLTLTNEGAGVQPIRKEARHVDGVVWRVDNLVLPAAGHWDAQVEILVTDFSEVTLEQAFDVRAH